MVFLPDNNSGSHTQYNFDRRYPARKVIGIPIAQRADEAPVGQGPEMSPSIIVMEWEISDEM